MLMRKMLLGNDPTLDTIEVNSWFNWMKHSTMFCSLISKLKSNKPTNTTQTIVITMDTNNCHHHGCKHLSSPWISSALYYHSKINYINKHTTFVSLTIELTNLILKDNDELSRFWLLIFISLLIQFSIKVLERR
jgi:hypothetical protein